MTVQLPSPDLPRRRSRPPPDNRAATVAGTMVLAKMRRRMKDAEPPRVIRRPPSEAARNAPTPGQVGRELMAPVQGVYDAVYNIAPATVRGYLPDKAAAQQTALGTFVRGGSRVAAGALPVYRALLGLGLGTNVVTAGVSAKVGNKLTKDHAPRELDRERLASRLESVRGFLPTSEDEARGDETFSLGHLLRDPGLVEKIGNLALTFPEDLATALNPKGLPFPPEHVDRVEKVVGKVFGPEFGHEYIRAIRGYLFNDWEGGEKLETPWWSPFETGKDRETVARWRKQVESAAR